MSRLNHVQHVIKTFDSTPIESFESVLLHISGMRFRSEYEILKKEDKAEISEYEIRIVDRKDERVLQRQTMCDLETILKLFNDCKLLSWDGFVGNHPKGVTDGTMFTLEAILNGKRIYAHGSENFPRHYQELTDGICAILAESEHQES